MSEDHSKNWPPEFLCIPLDQVEEWRKSGSIPGATSAASGATSAAAGGTSAASGGTASSSCDNHSSISDTHSSLSESWVWTQSATSYRAPASTDELMEGKAEDKEGASIPTFDEIMKKDDFEGDNIPSFEEIMKKDDDEQRGNDAM